MTRKDFELIARTIKGLDPGVRYALGHVFADALEKHGGNANFDRYKFLHACGVAVQSDCP